MAMCGPPSRHGEDRDRDTRVDTMTMPVTMASAKVGDGMFAVVSAPLPAEIAASPGASRGWAWRRCGRCT